MIWKTTNASTQIDDIAWEHGFEGELVDADCVRHDANGFAPPIDEVKRGLWTLAGAETARPLWERADGAPGGPAKRPAPKAAPGPA